MWIEPNQIVFSQSTFQGLFIDAYRASSKNTQTKVTVQVCISFLLNFRYNKKL